MRLVMIVMSYGNMVVEIVNFVKMIVGEMENVFVIVMKEDDGFLGMIDKLEVVLVMFDL